MDDDDDDDDAIALPDHRHTMDQVCLKLVLPEKMLVSVLVTSKRVIRNDYYIGDQAQSKRGIYPYSVLVSNRNQYCYQLGCICIVIIINFNYKLFIGIVLLLFSEE